MGIKIMDELIKMRDYMATSSFNKNFVLDNKNAVKSFTKMISNPNKCINIDETLVSPDQIKRGEEKLKKILSH
jgi:hypothetical protein